MKKTVAFFLCLLMVSGCFSKDKKKVVCTGSVNGINITSILYAEGDDVQAETYEEITDLTQIGYNTKIFSEAEKQEVIELLSSKKYDLNDIKNKKGIKMVSSIDENNFVMSLTVNYDEAELQDLKNLHFIESEGFINFGVSLKKTKENYQSSGLTCK